MIAASLAALARLISGTTARWVDCEPDTRQRIYYANHTSHLDFVVLWSLLPPDVRALARPVAAQDYWGRGKLRRDLITKVFNGVLVERGNVSGRANRDDVVAAAGRTVDRVADAFGEQYSLILFPEGTRGTGHEIGTFKSGLYHLCLRKPDAELVPVYLDNLNRILPKGALLPVPLLSSATFGPPFRLREGEPKAEFLARARAALGRLKPA